MRNVRILKSNPIQFTSLSLTNEFIDPSSFFDQLSATTADTFVQSFGSRVIGTIVGNILAGVAFKFVVDLFLSIIDSRKKKEELMPSVEVEKIAPPKITSDAWIKLLICISIDAISDSSFLLPGIGEIEDVAWAPISAFAMRYLFNSDAVAIAEFVKEALPFTDIIPLACTVWLLENVFFNSPFAKLLNLKNRN
jgi:hypothetical protein